MSRKEEIHTPVELVVIPLELVVADVDVVIPLELVVSVVVAGAVVKEKVEVKYKYVNISQYKHIQIS